MSSLRVITPPDTEPLTLEQAKAHLRVTADTQDAKIEGMIPEARAAVEAYCNRCFCTQTLRLRLDAFPAGVLRLPGGVVASISSLTYVDEDGAEQTLTGFQQDLDSTPARLAPAFGESWPETRAVLGAVNVTYIAGSDTVPPAVVAAIKLVLGDLYASTESVIAGTIVAENPTVRALLDPHRADILLLGLEQ